MGTKPWILIKLKLNSMKIINRIITLFVLVAGIVSCEQTDETSFVLQEVSAPTKVNAVFDIANDDTGTVTVTPTAEGASSFEVYFGDTTDETPTTVSPGETISHVYAEGEYTLRVVAIGATGLTSELSRVVTISFNPPTELAIAVAVSNANPFMVTVTPTAENATVYDVYFGDEEDAEPTTIMDGESAEHTYAEVGDYTVRVVARGAGAATIEATETVSIAGATDPIVLPIDFESATINYAFESFGNAGAGVIDNPDASGINTSAKVGQLVKPEGAEVWAGTFLTLGTPIDLTQGTTFQVSVWSPKSGATVRLKLENATNPDVFAELDAVTTTANAWENLVFDFGGIDTTTELQKVVLFFDFGNAGDGAEYYFDNVGQVTASEALPQLPLDFEAGLAYEWVGFGAADFGPIPAAVISNPDMSGSNTSANVVEITKTAGAQVWAGASLQLDGAIDFTPGTTALVKVWSPRAGTPILFKIEDTSSTPDNNGNPSVFVEVTANTTTAMAWEELAFDLTSAAAFDSNISYDRVILFPDFGNAGNDEAFYFDDIMLGTGGGNTGGTAEPMMAAPTPNEDAASVISLFSDAYTDVTVDTWRTDWSQADFEDVMVSGDATKKYSNLSFVGIETVANQIDVNGMTHFRTDVWTADATEIRIKLVDFGADGGFDGGDDTEHEIVIANPAQNEWISLDIPLTDFTGLTNKSNIAQLIYSGNPAGATTLFLDNIYFYSAAAASTEPTAAAPTPTVAAANVISLFSDAYTDVTVDTWRTDWSQADFEDVMVAENATKKYSNLSFVGIETIANQIDATSMTHFHLDVWTADATEIRIKLVDFGADGSFDGGDDTEHEIVIANPAQNQWLSLDIPLSDFTGLINRDKISQLILSGNPSGAMTLYVDNIYFHN